MPVTFPTYNPPANPYLDIIYEDVDILVVNKQSGLLSVAGKDEALKDCVEYRTRMQFGWSVAAHRLDMDTSGLIIIARNKPALAHISQQFEKRQVQKTYAAVLFGNVADDEGEIDLPLRCDWPNRPKQMVCHDEGRVAHTKYKVVERSNISGNNITRVIFTPLTGRTHQLRVHAQALGHPILGDPLYADGQALLLSSRLQLHAQSISFTHPTLGQELNFNSPAPF